MYSALDLVDGYYQLLMRASDIPLTAISIPRNMLWEWLVMTQGLLNALATQNRLVMQLFLPHRAYAQAYFDDIFVHSRAEQGRSDVDNHIDHLRAVLECTRTNIIMHQNVSLVRIRSHHFCDASFGSEAFGQILKSYRPQWIGQFLRIKRSTQVAWHCQLLAQLQRELS